MKCNLCYKEIKTKKERYVNVRDFNKEKLEREIWCHLACFNKAMNRELTELEKQAKDMLGRAGVIFNKIAPQVEEYELK
jgi:hypothetical protein